MTKNTSNLDRIVRLVLAVAFFGIGFAVGITTVGGIILGVLGLIMVVTAAVGFCPLYRLLGLHTNKTAS